MRIDEIENHGDDQFYNAVAQALGEQLACEVKLAGIANRIGRSSSKIKEIKFNAGCDEGAFNITVSQKSEMGQSSTKPYISVDVTDTRGLGEGSITLGRVGIFYDDPAGFAAILNHQNQISDRIDDLIN